jgi:phage baseplate assembly protein gpV
MVDAAGNAYPHTTIFNVPYLRMFGGNNGNAIILDPQPGDIGVAVFASRDITSVKATQAQANPGSARQYDFSDALYIGGMLNGGTPTQYIQFTAEGITIVSPVAITLRAPQINLEGNVAQTEGTMSVGSDLTAGEDSISLISHTHSNGNDGDPTGPPIT